MDFTHSALRKLVETFKDIVNDPGKAWFGSLKIEKHKETWRYDTFEEFLAQFTSDRSYARLTRMALR